MSRDLCNHVLCRIHHLVNRIVVFLESHVFSSLAKLLHLVTRIKVEHKTRLSGILSYGRLFKWTNWCCGVWHIWQACHSLAALANLKDEFELFVTASGIDDPKQQRALLLHLAGPGIQDIFHTIPEETEGDTKDYKKAMESLNDYFKLKKNIPKARQLSRSEACTRWANE